MVPNRGSRCGCKFASFNCLVVLYPVSKVYEPCDYQHSTCCLLTSENRIITEEYVGVSSSSRRKYLYLSKPSYALLQDEYPGTVSRTFQGSRIPLDAATLRPRFCLREMLTRVSLYNSYPRQYMGPNLWSVACRAQPLAPKSKAQIRRAVLRIDETHRSQRITPENFQITALKHIQNTGHTERPRMALWYDKLTNSNVFVAST